MTRLLEFDIPRRVENSFGIVWLYRDPDGHAVGFSTLDVCRDYSQFTDGKYHSYIPLLAVHPQFQKRGHGRTILEHLIGEAVLIGRSSQFRSDLLFLDVYTANVGAIALYEKCGFIPLNAEMPIPDPNENNETYIVMAKRISLGTG